MKPTYSTSTIVVGAKASEPILEMVANKVPHNSVVSEAILYVSPELVTLESQEQCKAYLLAIAPGIDPIQLLHQASKSPKAWAPVPLIVKYLPGITKGACPGDAMFSMVGKKPVAWPAPVDLVIYRHEDSAEAVPHVCFTMEQKFRLHMVLTPAAKDWNDIKEQMQTADLAHANNLLDQSARKLVLVR